MNELIETAIFWTALILISNWLLGSFYFPSGEKLIHRLKTFTFFFDVATINLLFFPWIPTAQGGTTGWELIFHGHFGVAILAVLLIIAGFLLLSYKKSLFKAAALLNSIAAIYIFVLLIVMFPETINLSFRDTAPIFAIFFLLIANVSGLLLWHQMQKTRTLKHPNKKLGISSLLIALAITFCVFLYVNRPNVPAQTDVLSFSDVGSTYKYATAIRFLKDNDVVNGYPDGTFQPDKALTRAEFMKIIMLGSRIDPAEPTSPPFKDVPIGEWYSKFVAYGSSHGYIDGYPDGTFKPDREINKVEALKILGNLVSWDLNGSNMSQTQNPYSDANISEWYGPYLAYAINHNILDDPAGLYNPATPISRGQMSEYIYRDYFVREANGAPYNGTTSGGTTVGGTEGRNDLCTGQAQALAVLKNDIIAKIPAQDDLLAYQYPSILGGAESFQYFSDASAEGQTRTLSSSENGKWLYWLDLHPGAKFFHPAKLVLLDSGTCDYNIYETNLWPIVNNQEIWNTDVKRIDSSDLVYEGSKAEPEHAVAAAAAPPIIAPCNNDGSARKMAILAYFGDDNVFKYDASKMNDFLCSQGYLISHIDNQYNDPLQQILDQVNALVTISHRPNQSFNHFTFYVTSHGAENTGDIFVGLEDYTNAAGNPAKRKKFILLNDLASVMNEAFENMHSEAFTILHDSCYSGNAIPKYQFEASDDSSQGWIGTSSAADVVSYGISTGSRYTIALLACMNNITPYSSYDACIDGHIANVISRGKSQDSQLEKLSPSTPDFMPLL